MRVIENNYKKEKEFICNHCKSKLGATIEDIIYDIDGDGYIKCPVCGHTFYVDKNNWFND